jgi:hypothetical protein
MDKEGVHCKIVQYQYDNFQTKDAISRQIHSINHLFIFSTESVKNWRNCLVDWAGCYGARK